MRKSLGAFVGGFVVVALMGACGGKKVEPATAQTVAAAADTVAAPVDTAAAADTAAVPETVEEVAAEVAVAEEVAAAGEAYAAAEEVAAGEKTFDDLSDEEKKTFMKQVVMPKMRPLFQDYDSKEFGKFTCATCHGPAAKEGKFEMPNPKLPKLPGTAAGWDKLKVKEAKMIEFMHNEVTPAMVTLLHEEEFDMKTGKGFGCFGCHVKE